MVKQETNWDMLNGIKEICRYVNRSEPTVLRWIQLYDMPAKKVGGTWVSSRKAIDKWLKKNIYDKKRA